MSSTPTRVMRAVVQQLLLAALVALSFQASTGLLTVSKFVPVSVIAGLATAILLLTGPRSAIAIALGLFAAQWQLGRTAGPAAVASLIQTTQALAGWAVVVHLFRCRDRFDRPRDVVALAAAGAAEGFVRAAGQAPLLLFEGRLGVDQLALASVSLWISAFSGVLVFTPAMLAVTRGGLFSNRTAGRRELVIAMGLGVLMQAAVFLMPRGIVPGMMIFMLGVLPLLSFVAVRGTANATAVMTGVIALIVMAATSRHVGPFGAESPPRDMQLVQMILAPVGMFMLLLSSAEMSRRRAIRALSATHARMERALEGSDSGLWEWRADTARNSYDARIARMFGEPADAGLHLPIGPYDGVHPEDTARLKQALRDHIDGRTPAFEVEIRHKHRDGHYVWVLDRGRVMERALDGSPLLLSGSLTDITTRKRIEEERAALEERMLQTQKLEGLGLLAGGVAHDFNNILTGVLGHADLARREVPAGSLAQEHLDHILAGARAAADLTRQMLAFAGRGHVAMQPVALAHLVTEMGHLLQVSISPNAIVRYDLGDSVPAVNADPAQLRQVVMNLILNAAEALGPEGGVITVRVRAQWCDRAMLTSRWMHDELPEGRYVVLEVRDDGSGMAPETLARIFDPFFSTKFTGRGLGLAAVLGIVRGHRGSVLVDTAPGRGTTFRVMLPPCAATTEPDARDAPSPQWQGVGLVLVVDDEQSVRTLAELMLRRLGFKVISAQDGAEALVHFRKQPEAFRVVLLDLTMPGMDGLTVAREMHAIDPDVRVVLTTGYSAPPWSAGPSPAGMVGFLEKPYRLEDLTRVLRQALETVRV